MYKLNKMYPRNQRRVLNGHGECKCLITNVEGNGSVQRFYNMDGQNNINNDW